MKEHSPEEDSSQEYFPEEHSQEEKSPEILRKK